MDFITNIWEWLIGLPGIDAAGVAAFIITILQVIVNLTPTEVDNNIFKWLKENLIDWIPNRKTGGGVHGDEEKK